MVLDYEKVESGLTVDLQNFLKDGGVFNVSPERAREIIDALRFQRGRIQGIKEAASHLKRQDD